MNLAVDCLGFMEIFIVSLFSSSVDLDLFVFFIFEKVSVFVCAVLFETCRFEAEYDIWIFRFFNFLI